MRPRRCRTPPAGGTGESATGGGSYRSIERRTRPKRCAPPPRGRRAPRLRRCQPGAGLISASAIPGSRPRATRVQPRPAPPHLRSPGKPSSAFIWPPIQHLPPRQRAVLILRDAPDSRATCNAQPIEPRGARELTGIPTPPSSSPHHPRRATLEPLVPDSDPGRWKAMSWRTRAPPSAGKLLTRFRKPRERQIPHRLTSDSFKRSGGGATGQPGCHWLSPSRCNGRWRMNVILGGPPRTTLKRF